ncbi:calcium/sodium antiporter [Psychromarinibacter halotolerans]|uniref:Calcium/sodium antiporter n=1 Tax=Psychromarinibacter halotolerans TaxID=1775175 RepID=A0ABV7GLP5_9RHOB|nr:calcium/sodium antiporter [Psychromarinibacter halotolerans]MDF0597784.1 calcium/sodium antiporter [Psychromarinibacter halotolerans]
MDYLLAAAGLVILLVAGDLLVRGAVNLALRLGIPALIVSLTVVAFGTSAPELVISVGSILDGAPGLALGNVVGSNTANVLLVLGVPALMTGLATGSHDTKKSYWTMMLATVVFIGLAFLGPITWLDGLVLLAVFAAVIGEQIYSALKDRREAKLAADDDEAPEGADPNLAGWKIGVFLALGLVGLPLGAQLLVDSAVNIATAWGVSETVIGLTLVAIGTSLPELATTVAAALRRQADVALGNVIGSNLFNLLFILGVASLFGDIPVDASFLRLDLWVMLAASVVLAPTVIRRKDMGRMAGIVLSLLYVAYLVLILVMN